MALAMRPLTVMLTMFERVNFYLQQEDIKTRRIIAPEGDKQRIRTINPSYIASRFLHSHPPKVSL